MAKNYFADEPMPSLISFDEASPVQKPEEKGFLSNFGNLFKSGFAGGIESDFETVEQLGGDAQWVADTKEAFGEISKAAIDNVSPELVEAMNQKASEGYDDIDWWLGNLGQLTGTIGAFAATGFGVGSAVKLGAKGTAKIIGKEMAEAAVKKGLNKSAANAIGTVTAGMVMGGGDRAKQARDEFLGLSDEDLDQSNGFVDEYWKLKDTGFSQDIGELRKKAKENLAEVAASKAFANKKAIATDLLASGVGGYVGGLGSPLSKIVKPPTTAKGRIATGAAKEVSTEAAQEGITQLASNEALQELGVNRALDHNVGEAALAGGLLGLPSGAIGGAFDKSTAAAKTEPEVTPERAPDPTTEKVKETNSVLGEAMESMDKHSENIKNDVTNFDIPAVARQAGASNDVEAARFGDVFTSPLNDALRSSDNQTVADMVNSAANNTEQTPYDREVITGEALPPEQGTNIDTYQQQVDNIIDGEVEQINGLLGSPNYPFSVPIDHTLPSPTRQIEDKNIIFGEDNTQAIEQVERAEQARDDLANQPKQLTDKNITFASDNSGVNVSKSGKPFKSEKEARTNKLARKAKREGLNVEVVPFGNGYGWQVSNLVDDQKVLVDDQDQANQKVNNLTKKEENLPDNIATGKKAKVYTPSNNEIETEYQLIDASEVVASNDIAGAVNPDYPSELQPRDRSRASSQVQVQTIAKNIKPERLGNSNETDRGAPIVKNGVVESGNGRAIALKEAYRVGGAKAYKQYLRDNAQAFGLTVEQVNSMEQPILVRNRLTDMTPEQRIAYTVDSNRSAGIEQGPAELAKSDASLLDEDDMKLLFIPEGGDLFSPANERFINVFAQRLGSNESSKYRQANGEWNSQFAARINNAIFAKGYNDNDLLSSISESTTQESKNLLNALMNVAGTISEIKGFDENQGIVLGDTFAAAAQLIIKARRQNTSVTSLTSQTDLLSGGTKAEVETLAVMLDSNIRSSKNMQSLLRDIANQIKVAAQNKDQADIFTGEVTKQPTVTEAINNVAEQRAGNEQIKPSSTDLFSGSQSRQQEPSATNSVGANASESTSESTSESGTAGPVEKASLKDRKEKARKSKLDSIESSIDGKIDAAADELSALFKDMTRRANSGIDPQIAIAGAKLAALYLAKGSVKFAKFARDILAKMREFGISESEVKPYLKKWYFNAQDDVSDSILDQMDDVRTVRKADLNKIIASDDNVPTTSENLEQISESQNQEQEYSSDNANEPSDPEQIPRRSEQDATQEERSDSEPSLSANDDTLLGERSANSLLDADGQFNSNKETSNTRNTGRSGGNNDIRASTEPAATAATSEATQRLAPKSAERETQQNNTHSAKWGEKDDILNSVPVLMPEQAGDIALIEKRFFGEENQGVGYLNTNGTGTGKTFVGLGAIKRLVQSGKDNILIVVPNDGIAQQWVKAAREFFGLELYLLGSNGGAKTKDAGQGITIATYSTLGNNKALIKERDQFDLIVSDESQNLMGSQQAKETNALGAFRALTNHERGSYKRARAMLSEKVELLDEKIDKKYAQLLPLNDNAEAAKREAKEFYSKELNALESEIRALSDKFKEQGQFDTKTLFLSATPFPYVKNLDYAEGYLFNFTDYGDKHEGGYDNAFHGHNAFFIQNFGYRWRYHKLNTPGGEVDQSLMERQFHENMKEKGVLGGRTLEVEADYKRDFIKVETAAGEKLDDLIEKWRDHEVEDADSLSRPYSELADILNKAFDYTSKIKLVEAIKAEAAAERALDHLNMGRKVVIFHSYNVGGSFDPIQSVRQEKPELLAQFESEYPGMTNIDFGVLDRPLDLFAEAFGDKVRFYNGNVPDKARKEAKDLFNEDNSGVDVIVVQQEAGEAGISLHDVTGNNQRVLINIGMPVKPTQLIQIEGRTYRVGVKTDAQFEVLTTGTAFERSIFASKIAGRASTAENLAMGEFARSLKENISEGYLDAEYKPAQTRIGKGGKQADKPTAINEWDKAKALYYANLKRNSSNKSAEGDDYFATPEPVGKKMIDWLQPTPGHRLLEPSIGHGAIGRWFPGTTRNKATEKSFKLTSLAQMNFNGEVTNQPFEDLNVINKFDGIAMNPPFGKGGKLAYDHVRKALSHLANGGRVVALVPDGPMANKRLDKLLTDESLENIHFAAEISLANGVFERAGTNVKTKIIVLDRFDSEADAPNTQYVNFEGAQSVNELFERIEDVELLERNTPTIVEADTTQYMDAESKPTTDRKGTEQYKIKLYGYLPNDVKDIIDKEAINEFGARPTRDETVYFVDSAEARTDLAQFIANTINEAKDSGVDFNFKVPVKRKVVEGQASNEHFKSVGEVYTTKRGKEFIVTEMKGRQEYSTYKELKELAKEYDGWARGQKFMFTNNSDLEQFNEKAKALIDGEGDIKFSKSKARKNAKGMKASRAQAVADKFIKSLNGANGITVKILGTTSEAEKLWRMSLAGSIVKGAYSDTTKTVYVIAENIDNANDLKQTLAHETIAHGGLDTVFTPEQHQAFIDRIQKTRGRKAFSQYWIDANKDYKNFSDDVKAEEIFARFVENEPTKGELKYWWNAFKRWIAKQLNKVGANFNIDSEVEAMREVMEAIVTGFNANNKNPNGPNGGKRETTSKTERAYNFNKWFGDSKAVDSNGEPVVVYHGTNANFSEFSKEKLGEATEAGSAKLGFFFASDPRVASSYADSESVYEYGFIGALNKFTNGLYEKVSESLRQKTGLIGKQNGANVMPVYLKLSNPLIVDQKNKHYDEEVYLGILEKAKAAGHDGVIIKNTFDEGFTDEGSFKTDIYVTFEPNQIKSASGNNGEFDAENNDLLFSKKAADTAEDTRTAKEKLGLEDGIDQSITDYVKEKTHEKVETLKSDSFWKRLNEGIFDGLSGIKQAEDSVGITDPNKQGYVSARLASGLADVLHGVFNYGAPQWKDGVVQRKEDTKGLLEVFGGLGDDLNNWLAWMGAQRAEKLAEEGKENNLTQADIDELKALAKGKEKEFEAARIEYNKINSAILDLSQEAGLLSSEQRGAFDEEYYVPFFRDMGETDPEMDDIKRMIVEPHTRKGIAGQSAQIKELKGGGQSTKDLLENIIARQSTLIDASLKNKAMMEVTDNLSGTDYMQAETSEDIANLSQQELNKLHRVKVMRNGKAQAYVVSDPALLRALIHVNDVGSKSLFNKIGRGAKRFLTAGITLSPDFIFKNFVRDAAHAWMVNKDDFKFGSDSIKGLKKAFKEDEVYRDLIFSGAAFQGGYIHGADPEAGAQQIRRALRKKGLNAGEVKSYMDSLITSGSQLIEKYKGISDKVENANRLSTYEAALAAGKSKRQAAYESKDLIDYSLKGNFALIGTMIDMLPFFNARLQGMSKLVRAAKAGESDKVLKVLSANLAMKGMKVAAFSLALAALNEDDEDYQELPDWDKDANWHFFVDGDHFRIPKPFELGIIFGTVPERIFNYGTGKQTGGDLTKSVGHAVFNTLALNPIPQMALPMVENSVNKSFFRDSPIEGMADQNKQAQDRYASYTSELSKALGSIVGASPKKIDHLIKGYTGTIGGYVLGASDIIAQNITGKITAEAPVSRYPVVKAFYQGDGPKTNTKFANEFYEALETTKEAYGSYKRAMELGDTSRQKELIENEGDKLRSRVALNRIQRATSKLSKQARAINDNDRLSSSQKRERLDSIQRQKNALYHRAYVTFNIGEW